MDGDACHDADPFRGPSNAKAWTGGRAASTHFAVPLGDFTDVQLPPGIDWRKDMPPASVPMRTNAGVSLLEWASMGYWRNKQHFLLIALSARLPDFYVASWSAATESEGESCFLAVRCAGKLYTTWGSAPTKTRAKAIAAELMLSKMGLFLWLSQSHKHTPCEKYLRPAQE